MYDNALDFNTIQSWYKERHFHLKKNDLQENKLLHEVFGPFGAVIFRESAIFGSCMTHIHTEIPHSETISFEMSRWTSSQIRASIVNKQPGVVTAFEEYKFR